MRRKSLPFHFKNERGQKLSGILDMPEQDPLAYGVFAPCFTCTKESHAAHKICRALSENNIAMLRFDLTGIGASEGDFAETNFSTRVQDIVSACRALAAEYQFPKLLIGHSISGTAGIVAVKHLPQVQALATLGAPRDAAYIIDKFKRNNQIVIKGEMAELTVAGRKVAVRKTFVDDMLSHDVGAATAAYNRKLFIFHAPHDEIVHFENARTIDGRATCDKELLPLSEGATHLLEQGTEDASFIADGIRNWFEMHAE